MRADWYRRIEMNRFALAKDQSDTADRIGWVSTKDKWVTKVPYQPIMEKYKQTNRSDCDSNGHTALTWSTRMGQTERYMYCIGYEVHVHCTRQSLRQVKSILDHESYHMVPIKMSNMVLLSLSGTYLTAFWSASTARLSFPSFPSTFACLISSCAFSTSCSRFPTILD